jgi:hypothetical protein
MMESKTTEDYFGEFENLFFPFIMTETSASASTRRVLRQPRGYLANPKGSFDLLEVDDSFFRVTFAEILQNRIAELLLAL